MNENLNIQISLSLFKKISSFFVYLSLKGYTFPSMYGFDNILAELQEKQHKLNIHTAYTNTIIAKDGGQRRQAYENYQKLKNRR